MFRISCSVVLLGSLSSVQCSPFRRSAFSVPCPVVQYSVFSDSAQYSVFSDSAQYSVFGVQLFGISCSSVQYSVFRVQLYPRFSIPCSFRVHYSVFGVQLFGISCSVFSVLCSVFRVQ